jgi:hypothetical protein
MECPPKGGEPHTVRSLAKAVGLSYSKIQKLITEERPDVDGAHADRIASEVHVRRRALFSPSSSPSWDGDQERGTTDGPR